MILNTDVNDANGSTTMLVAFATMNTLVIYYTVDSTTTVSDGKRFDWAGVVRDIFGVDYH